MDRYFKIYLNEEGNNEIILSDPRSSLYEAISDLNVNKDHITKVIECDCNGVVLETKKSNTEDVCLLCNNTGEYSFGGSFDGPVKTVICPCGR